MTPLREALALPWLFLTVVLLAGLRLGAQVRLVPPPLVSLVLAVLLVGALVRSGALLPERLMNQRRTTLENLSGFVVLLTLFAATAQIFNLVTPDTGLLHLLVSVFFVVQLLTTLTGVRDRLAMLRSVVVLLGSAFVLRFVALESLYSPGRGLMKRLMTALLEGVTLGALDYQPAGTATGYVAFAALALYVIGLVLAGSGWAHANQSGPPVLYRDKPDLVAPATPLLALLLLLGGTMGCSRPVDGAAPNTASPLVTAPQRDAALAGAHVWRQPDVSVSAAQFGDTPATPFRGTVSCRFIVDEVSGTTPKFHCTSPDGEILKVKYGRNNAELFAEVAATRLLTALGFGADEMFAVERVRCYGCPLRPFTALRCYERTGLSRLCFLTGLDYDDFVDFEPAVIERRIAGRRIEAVEDQGWAWHELDRIDPDQGGAPRQEVDALRLVAMVLAHWDNKSENQRLICPPSAERPDGSCAAPLALIQDLGATFGPTKLDLPNWRRTPIWSDADTCRVSMEGLPFGGATFPETQISEEGRTLLLGLLEQLSYVQLRDLFASARVDRFNGVSMESRNPEAWVRIFQDKVRQVRDAGPCPTVAALAAEARRPSSSAP